MDLPKDSPFLFVLPWAPAFEESWISRETRKGNFLDLCWTFMSPVTILGPFVVPGNGASPLGQCSGGSAFYFRRLNSGKYGIGGFDTERNLRSGLLVRQSFGSVETFKTGLSTASPKRLARRGCACGLASLW